MRRSRASEVSSTKSAATMSESWYVVAPELHDEIVRKAFMARDYDEEEATSAAGVCRFATHHGNQTHNSLKALDVDEYFGSVTGGCVPKQRWEVLPSRFAGVERWDAKKCNGFLVADAAMARACELAERYGTGAVAVDNAFHYLMGAKYVCDAAAKGYIAFTTCTGAIPEVSRGVRRTKKCLRRPNGRGSTSLGTRAKVDEGRWS